jgi:hypothetical protein
MVVHKIDIEGFAVLEEENNSPVGAHGYRPKAFEVAGKRMKPEGRNVDVGNFLRVTAKICLILRTCSGFTPFGRSSQKLSQPLVLKALDHCPSIGMRVV